MILANRDYCDKFFLMYSCQKSEKGYKNNTNAPKSKGQSTFDAGVIVVKNRNRSQVLTSPRCKIGPPQADSLYIRPEGPKEPLGATFLYFREVLLHSQLVIPH